MTFDVYVNGSRVCRAGTDPDGGLHAIISCRGGPRQGCAPPLELSVSGVDGRTEEVVRWPMPELKVGDEVLVRITDSDGGEPPRERIGCDPAKLLRQKQDYVRQMAAEWGWEIRPEPSVAPDRRPAN